MARSWPRNRSSSAWATGRSPWMNRKSCINSINQWDMIHFPDTYIYSSFVINNLWWFIVCKSWWKLWHVSDFSTLHKNLYLHMKQMWCWITNNSWKYMCKEWMWNMHPLFLLLMIDIYSLIRSMIYSKQSLSWNKFWRKKPILHCNDRFMRKFVKINVWYLKTAIN